MKRLLSVILALVLAFSSASFASYAFAQEGEILSEPIVVDNPFYAGREIPSGSIDGATDASVAKSYNGATYYTLGRSLYDIVKNKCVARTTSFDLYILSKGTKYTTSHSLRVLMDDLWSNATDDQIATGCTDGDYLRWSLGYVEIKSLTLTLTKDGYYYYKMSISPYYYSTADEEKAVDNVVNNFIASTDTNSLSDYETIKKIHDFICSKTTYDYKATDKTLYDYSAYGALVKGLSVCQGYSNAFYRLCKELGYKARIITSDPYKGCHAWNIVCLDNKYYFVDATWDDEIFDKGESAGLEPYYFFLTNYDKSISEDTHYQHIIEDNYYDNQYFNDNYRSKFAPENYDVDNLELLSRCKIKLSNKVFYYDGKEKKPAVTVITGSGNTLTQGVDYNCVYASNVNNGFASAYVYGTGSYENDSTRRYFEIHPSKSYTPWISSRGTNSVSLKWNANGGGVNGYIVDMYSNGKWSTVAYVSSPAATVGSLSPSSIYYFRVRAYRYISKRAVYSDYSDTTLVVTVPLKVTTLKLKTSKKKITANWNKVTGTGYQVQYSVNKNMKGAKVINIVGAKNRKRVLKKLKSKKKYYVRVRAFKRYTEAGQTKYVYGAWSSKKAIKCK